MFTQTRIVMLSVLFASTIGCAETTGESDGSVSSDPQTVTDIQGMWAAEDQLVLELSDMPGPPSRVTTNTFGSTDGEYWCDRVTITF